MSPASFLLRLLLAASLVITTTGGALASMRMHLAQAGAVAVAESDCHDPPAIADTGIPHATAAVAAPSAPADHADCCLGGDCDDICLLSLPPLPSAAFIAATPLSRTYSVEAHTDRPAPRLTRPQRPPIA